VKLFQIILIAVNLHMAGSLCSAKTLTVLLLANASTQGVIQNFLKEYSRTHSGIDFNVSIVQYSALTAKINTLVTAGEPPDILEVTTAYIQTFAEQALDLAKYTNGADLLNRYLPSYQAFIRSGDKVIGIPIEATVNGLFYNKNLFKEAGASVPADSDHVWSWSEFKDTVQKVMKLPSCRIGVAFDCSVQRWSNLLYQANGRWISDDGKSILPNRDAAKRALTYFRSLIEAKLVPTSSWPGKTDGRPIIQDRCYRPYVGRQLGTEDPRRRRDRVSVWDDLFPEGGHASRVSGRRIPDWIQKSAESRRFCKDAPLVGRALDNKALSRKSWGVAAESYERSACQLR
jgi:ABC-type glycerol-3-phosphate transport system substrate-binding protein